MALAGLFFGKLIIEMDPGFGDQPDDV